MSHGPELPASVPPSEGFLFSEDTIGAVGTLTLVRATERVLINSEKPLAIMDSAPNDPAAEPAFEVAQATIGRFYSLTGEIGASPASGEEPGSPEAERRTLVERFLTTSQSFFRSGKVAQWPNRPDSSYKPLKSGNHNPHLRKLTDLTFTDNFDPSQPPVEPGFPMDEMTRVISGLEVLPRLMTTGWNLRVLAEFGANVTDKELVVQEFLRRSIVNMGGVVVFPEDGSPSESDPLKPGEGNHGK